MIGCKEELKIFCISIGVAAIASIVLNQINFRHFEMLVLDFKQRISFQPPPPNNFVEVRLPSRNHLNSSKEFFPFIKQALMRTLADVESGNPKLILLFLDTQWWQEEVTSENMLDLSRELSRFESLYLYSDYQEKYLLHDQAFASFPRTMLNGFKTYDSDMPPRDSKTRRLLLRFDESKKEPPLNEFIRLKLGAQIDIDSFKYRFPYLNTQQILIKYFPSGSYSEDVRLPKTDRYRDKVVLISFQDIYSSTTTLAPISSNWELRDDPAQVGDLKLSESEFFANAATNLTHEIYVKTLPAWLNICFLFSFLVVLSYLCLRAINGTRVIAVFSWIAFGNFFPILMFWVGNAFLESVPALLGSLLIPYFALPVVLYRTQKERELEKQRAQRDSERLRQEGQLAARSAEADATFKMATRVAHDIRSPLSALQILKSVAIMDDSKSQLMSKSIDRIEDIAATLLRNYKTKGRFGSGQRSVCKISQLEEDIRSHFQRLFPEISISLLNSSKVDYVDCSHLEIERIVFNLVGNSIEALNSFSKQHPCVQVNFADESNVLSITVSDNGPGIPTEIRDHLFQEGRTSGKKNGNGLGLANAKSYLEKIGGSIACVDSSAGATFKICIPTGSASAELLWRGHLVIADDDPEVLRLFDKVLPEPHHRTLTDDPIHARLKIQELVDSKQQFTLVTDLVFQGSQIVGFDLIAEAMKSDSSKSSTCMYSTLAGELQVQEMCARLGTTLIGKETVPKIIRVIK